MGKSAGDPPDPYATAQAQGASNDTTARLNARINRGNTVTPWGTVTNRDLGSEWVETELGKRRAAAGGPQWTDVPAFGPDIYSGGEGGGSLIPGGQVGTLRGIDPTSVFDEDAVRRELSANNPFADRWQTDVALSPEQQAIYNAQSATTRTTSEAANEAATRLRGLLGTNVDLSGLQAMPTDITGTGAIRSDYSGGAPLARMGSDDYEASRRRVEEAMLSRTEPAAQRDRDALEARMVAQGVGVGSEAYGSATDELSRARNDARMQAVLAGGQEQSRLFGLDATRLQLNNGASQAETMMHNSALDRINAAQAQGFGQSAQRASFQQQSRAQQLAERLQMRAQPINEVAALFGLGNGVTVPTAQQLAGSQSQSGDIQSGVNSAYSSKVAAANAGNQQAAQAAASMAMIAAMAMSDRRAKENVERVGKLDNGLPVYSYRYKTGGPTQIGVMAQDVEKENPGAVGHLFGIKLVNYDEATKR